MTSNGPAIALLDAGMRVLLLFCMPLYAANLCGPFEALGPYGFLLSGVNKISGTPKPAVSVGRIVLDQDRNISGYSSVNFDGLLLGNPVTGTYEIKSDCSISWSLQDDSGAFQHFTGTVTPGGNKVEFHQTDPGTQDQHGVMERTGEGCTAADLRPSYSSDKGVVLPDNVTIDPDCVVHIRLGDSNLRGLLVNRGAAILAIQTDPLVTVSTRFIAR